MKRIRILHRTEYLYSSPVSFGPHRVLVRPREGHDVHIESSILEIEPVAKVSWIRDTYGNSIANVTFPTQADRLSIFSEAVVAHYDEQPLSFTIDPDAASYPFQYSMDEQPELIPYRLASHPRDGEMVREWAEHLYKPGQLIGTFDILSTLNQAVHQSFRYERRDQPGTQTPTETLARGAGSCRDFAVLMMEVARHWGFGARFVTGYLQMEQGQHGATHAWTEIYIPGAGWRGFDPTNNTFAGAQHVSVAVARESEKAVPVSGAWIGAPGSFLSMNVDVQVSLI